MTNRLKLEMRAIGLGGIGELLSRFSSCAVGSGYTIVRPVACGATSIVFEAVRAGGRDRLACKMPLLAYHKPSTISLDQITSTRRRLEQEYRVLKTFNGRWWPKPVDLVLDENHFLPRGFGTEIRSSEHYLLMEWIEGETFAERCRTYGHSRAERRIEMLLAETVRAIVPALAAAARLGLLFIDLKPRHIIVNDGLEQWLRLLDAGGLWHPLHGTADLAVTPSYLPPALYKDWTAGHQPTPSEQWVIHSLGKTLLAGLGDLDIAAGREYSVTDCLPHLDRRRREYIYNLLTMKWPSVEDLNRETASYFDDLP